MLQLSAAGKRFGQKLLFEDANWLITPDERTGLVGGNGTGKSTLLKILAGIESLDYGTAHPQQGHRPSATSRRTASPSAASTVFAECLSVFDHLHELERESIELTHTLSEADPKSKEYAAAAERYSDIADQLHVHDIYTLDSQVGAVLGGLGFSKEDWDRKTEEFSGGWQMRIALAKLLLQKPSLLLLDEPTNHLDLESRNWLENYLHDYPNAYILISHDRYFLDVTVNKTVELWNKRMHTYHGNYEKYVAQKEERRTQLDDRLQKPARPHRRARSLHQPLPLPGHQSQAGPVPHQGTRKDRAHRGPRRRGHHPLLHPAAPAQRPHRHRSQQPHQGLPHARPAAKNSSSTTSTSPSSAATASPSSAPTAQENPPSSASSAGRKQPTTGTITLGHNVLADFFAQDQYKVLDPDAGMLDDITGAAPKVPVVELRSLLGCFMFSGDDVFKKLGVLSGGERNRYAMAKMLVSPSNFLLLDEPTNHLDLRAKDVLLDAIRNFTGTVLFVSHDRYFIDGLATRVFEVEDRRLHIYPGNYEDYLWRKQGGPEKVTEQITNSLAPTPQPVNGAAPSGAGKNQGRVPHTSTLMCGHRAKRDRFLPNQHPRWPARNPHQAPEPNQAQAARRPPPPRRRRDSPPRIPIAAAEARLGNFTSADQSQKDAAEVDALRTNAQPSSPNGKSSP